MNKTNVVIVPTDIMPAKLEFTLSAFAFYSFSLRIFGETPQNDLQKIGANKELQPLVPSLIATFDYFVIQFLLSIYVALSGD